MKIRSKDTIIFWNAKRIMLFSNVASKLSILAMSEQMLVIQELYLSMIVLQRAGIYDRSLRNRNIHPVFHLSQSLQNGGFYVSLNIVHFYANLEYNSNFA